MREISGGSGYGSQNAPYAYFGLGDATLIDTVRLEWSSGIVQEFHAVTARQLLTVTEPAVTVSPSSLTLNRGETASFIATTTLEPPLRFEWMHDGVAVPGAAEGSLLIPNLQAGDAGTYLLRIDQLDTSMSLFAKPVSLVGPVVFQSNQQLIPARPGSNLTFQAAFVGAPPVRLQWRHGQSLIPDATNTTLTLTNVQLADDGEYSVIASNSFGVVESLQGILVILIRPVITVQPVSQSVVAGGDVVLSITAIGHPLPLSFRWRKNGIAVTNMVLFDTNCFLTITNVQPNAGGNAFHYTVVVTNLAGPGAVSTDALLTVLADTDGDGLPDEWETAQGLGAADATDASLDSDGDTVTNAQEYLAGTDPHDPRDYLHLECLRGGASNEWVLRFTAVSNRTYTLMAREGFNPGETWSPVVDVPAAPTNRSLEFIQFSSGGADLAGQRLFRLATPRSR